MKKTTKKDFEYFINCCEQRIKELHLGEYKRYYNHTKLDGVYGETRSDTLNRVVSLCFNVEWDEARELNMAEIKKVAHHECWHILLDKITELCFKRFITKDEIKSAEEEVIHRLENYILS